MPVPRLGTAIAAGLISLLALAATAAAPAVAAPARPAGVPNLDTPAPDSPTPTGVDPASPTPAGSPTAQGSPTATPAPQPPPATTPVHPPTSAAAPVPFGRGTRTVQASNQIVAPPAQTGLDATSMAASSVPTPVPALAPVRGDRMASLVIFGSLVLLALVAIGLTVVWSGDRFGRRHRPRQGGLPPPETSRSWRPVATFVPTDDSLLTALAPAPMSPKPVRAAVPAPRTPDDAEPNAAEPNAAESNAAESNAAEPNVAEAAEVEPAVAEPAVAEAAEVEPADATSHRAAGSAEPGVH